jgi:hypothetical protein
MKTKNQEKFKNQEKKNREGKIIFEKEPNNDNIFDFQANNVVILS